MHVRMLYTIVLALLHHLFTCICPLIFCYYHILITFRNYLKIISLPHYPPLFPPTPSSRPPMAVIIACYSVYAHYHQRVGMYVCEPARVGACMYAERGFRSFSFFGQLSAAPLTAALLSEVGSDGYHAR